MKLNLRTLLPWLTAALFSVTGVVHAQTINWQENWESPVAQDNWYADNGYWEIGVPTYGPPDRGDGWLAHQGTNVAATVLNGDYTDNRQSRLISSQILVPTENPRLRFWHWWSFNVDDFGEVQISTNNGLSWTAISPRFGQGSPLNYHSDGKWARAWLDLTPYAGKTVRLGLYFYSYNYVGGVDVGPGWYVDEIAVESGPLPEAVFPDSFEDVAALDRWNADFGVWELGVPTSGPGGAHSGSNCLATILSGDYNDNRSSLISSRPFVVPAAGLNPRLRFWHWWNFSVDDFGQVLISTNNGTSWIGLSPRYGHGSPANYHSDLRWTQAWLDLASYAGKTVRLGLYFYSYNYVGGVDVGPGWHVDDISVETGPLAGFTPSDNFEDAAALDRWTADFGVWEIGVPSSGPNNAHNGSNCLATILAGDYYDDRTSRVSSRPFVVPPAEANPRLRWWHWWQFNTDDYGQVQISKDNGNSWTALATYTASSPWTRPQLDLAAYAGQTVRLGFLFRSYNYVGGVDVGPGWYIDEVRLLHEPALWLHGSPVVRTQDTSCVSLKIAVDSPATGASFVIEMPPGNLSNPTLTTEGCWSGTITPQSATEWLVNMQSSCTSGSPGVEEIGTICFAAVSPHSAFVPLTISSLVISNLAPAQAFGTRTVNIASEPLLEAWVDGSKKRMLSIYGKANTTYVIHQSTNLSTIRPWPPGWTNTVPTSMFTNSLVSGPLSNAPVLFLDALEQ